LQLLLRDRIAEGEVLAFGVQILPEPKDFGTEIPNILFQSPTVEIDWDQDQISGLGRQFSDVRICLRADSTTPSGKTIAATGPAKRGPKGYSAIFEQAFAELELEHKDFLDWSMEKQAFEIQERAVTLRPGRFRGSKPGRSTVYRFLRDRREGPSVP
jgi:hypothetical protein